MEGKIKWFNITKGYGFIESQEKDYFMHHSQIKARIILKQGDEVIFDPTNTERGAQAHNIKIKKPKYNEKQ